MDSADRGQQGQRRRPARPAPVQADTVVPLFAPPAPAAPAAAATAPSLPCYASSFVGRQKDVAGLVDLLGRHRLVTVSGPGGIGKTRTAVEVARAAAADQPDGVWLAELASVADAGLVEEAVRSAVGCCGPPERGDVDLVAAIGARRLLLLLDNCEHLVAACASLVGRLVGGCPGLAVLVTSREPLGVAGEQVHVLAPLGLPGPGDVDTVVLGDVDAVRLFVERGRAATGSFALDAGTAPVVAEICRRLDGVPLAIELAAARLGVLSPAEIAERLDDRFALLIRRNGRGEARHQSLRAAIEWSYDLLSAPEATLLARLSVFAGGFGLRAAEAVCQGDPVPKHEVLDLVDALAAKSLLAVDTGRPVTRYRLLESIRHFASGQLEASGEAEELARCHAAWCVARAERAERERRGQRYQAWLMALEEDHDNFRAALAWARRAGQADVVAALGGALTWFWETQGHLREGLEWLLWALANDVAADDRGERRAKALRGAGMMSWLLGDVSAAVPLVEESVVLFRRAGNDEEADGCVCADALHLCSNPSHSLPALQANVARHRASANPDRLGHALVNCGMAHYFLGQAGPARRCFEECLALPVGSLEPETVGAALTGLGRVLILVGDLHAADAALGEALGLAARTADDDGRSTALAWLGEAARCRGDYPRARRLLADALQLVQARGPALSVARCQQFLGRVELAEGRHDDARHWFGASLAEPGAADMPHHVARSLLGLAEVDLADGAAGDAQSRLGDVLALAEANGDLQATAAAWAGQARLARPSGDAERAEAVAHRALGLFEQVGDLAGVVDGLEQLGGLAVDAGRDDLPARLLAAAGAARAESGWVRPPAAAAAVARQWELVASRVGPQRLDQLDQEGAALSAAEAAAYAGRGWGPRPAAAAGSNASGWDRLTPTEAAAVALLADGLTNAEIGQRLFMSGRTVGTHLAHVYRKLGIATRRDLIRRAKEEQNRQR